MNVKCLIVDDEDLAIDVIAEYIKRIDYLELAGTCKSAVEA
ncbi:MAG: DNA-binding response regulator, partial [Marinilabiliaceae bacterium]|nr:DNA-binding response regulator [Marinilabiliaceae bacterium]